MALPRIVFPHAGKKYGADEGMVQARLGRRLRQKIATVWDEVQEKGERKERRKERREPACIWGGGGADCA